MDKNGFPYNPETRKVEMLVEVQFSTKEDLEAQAPMIQRVIGIPIVETRDTTLLIEADPSHNLDEVRALRGVTSVEIVRT